MTIMQDLALFFLQSNKIHRNCKFYFSCKLFKIRHLDIFKINFVITQLEPCIWKCYYEMLESDFYNNSSE